LIVR
jgi:hypothetical protein